MIHQREKDVGDMTPSGTPFLPYATMFKLDGPDSAVVECVACRAQFPLSDLLQSELEENCCPKCHTSARAYWHSRLHRPVPDDPASTDKQESD